MADVPPVVSPSSPSAPQPLGRLSYPLYVKALAAITAVAFLFALVRVPRTFRYGIDAERGRRDLAAGRYGDAVYELKTVVEAFPEAKDTRIDYAAACVKAGDFADAGQSLRWFEGKEVSKEQSARLDEIDQDGEQRMKELETLPRQVKP